MAHESIVHLTADNFADEAEAASVPVLVDFYTDWCGPCKMLAPVLDQVAEELGDSAKITKVDATAQQPLAQRFQITAVPTLLFMKGGEVIERGGMMSKEDIIAKLNSL